MQTVLIVDDEQSFSFLLEVVLQRGGFKTIVAEDGKEALALMRLHHPHLVILDENMPHMKGSEVYREMKSDPTLQDIPVIMHSSAVNLRKADLLNYERADAFLPKPSLPREVLDKVRKLVLPGYAASGSAGQAAV